MSSPDLLLSIGSRSSASSRAGQEDVTREGSGRLLGLWAALVPPGFAQELCVHSPRALGQAPLPFLGIKLMAVSPP